MCTYILHCITNTQQDGPTTAADGWAGVAGVAGAAGVAVEVSQPEQARAGWEGV